MSPGATALLFSFALASEPVVVEPADDVDDVEELSPAAKRAEYNRLSEEIQRLAARNAWSGVERYFGQLEATGVAIGFDELVAGASAARAVGNAKLMRDRLRAAVRVEESKEIIDWLWEVDDAHGTVFLACDPEWKNRPVLAIEAMPFDPNQARSVKFAVEAIAEACEFDGLLPGGKYTFGQYNFDVKPKVESVRIDTRGESEPKAKKKSE